MKKLSLICLLSLSLLSVQCDFLKIDDPKPELPPITMTGENTFGAIVNGKVWVPISKLKQTAIFQVSNNLQISAELEHINNGQEIDQDINILIFNEEIVEANFVFNSSKSDNFLFIFKDINSCSYDIKSDSEVEYSGFLNINNLDKVNHIISGTFEFTINRDGCPQVRIEQGRFDLKYIN
uniref:hypothetical protein n=1 Tax=Roseivirga sp. TaxID=1964215 RepID=UPI00404778B3